MTTDKAILDAAWSEFDRVNFGNPSATLRLACDAATRVALDSLEAELTHQRAANARLKASVLALIEEIMRAAMSGDTAESILAMANKRLEASALPQNLPQGERSATGAEDTYYCERCKKWHSIHNDDVV